MLLRYFGYGLILVLMIPIGWVLVPFLYKPFYWIYTKKVKPYWWFINSDEPTFFDNKFGSDWWREQKGIDLQTKWSRFWAFYRWNAIRNPVYSFKTYEIRPYNPASEKYNINLIDNTTNSDGLEFCNKIIRGFQFCTFYVDGKKQFRISATFKLLWFYQHFQFGMSDERYLYKIKWWSKKDIWL